MRDGVIVDRFYSLVHPVPNYYFRHLTENVHGISRYDTDDAPRFDEVWQVLGPWLEGLPLVAHNYTFDKGCLDATLDYYGLKPYERPFLCTLAAARSNIPRAMCTSYSLPYVAEFLGIPFDNHHNALCDAECCAKIAMSLL